MSAKIGRRQPSGNTLPPALFDLFATLVPFDAEPVSYQVGYGQLRLLFRTDDGERRFVVFNHDSTTIYP